MLQTRHKYGEKRINLLRACLRRELILLGRQRFLYIFRTGQARLLLRWFDLFRRTLSGERGKN